MCQHHEPLSAADDKFNMRIYMPRADRDSVNVRKCVHVFATIRGRGVFRAHARHIRLLRTVHFLNHSLCSEVRADTPTPLSKAHSKHLTPDSLCRNAQAAVRPLASSLHHATFISSVSSEEHCCLGSCACVRGWARACSKQGKNKSERSWWIEKKRVFGCRSPNLPPPHRQRNKKKTNPNTNSKLRPQPLFPCDLDPCTNTCRGRKNAPAAVHIVGSAPATRGARGARFSLRLRCRGLGSSSAGPSPVCSGGGGQSSVAAGKVLTVRMIRDKNRATGEGGCVRVRAAGKRHTSRARAPQLPQTAESQCEKKKRSERRGRERRGEFRWLRWTRWGCRPARYSLQRVRV